MIKSNLPGMAVVILALGIATADTKEEAPHKTDVQTEAPETDPTNVYPTLEDLEKDFAVRRQSEKVGDLIAFIGYKQGTSGADKKVNFYTWNDQTGELAALLSDDRFLEHFGDALQVGEFVISPDCTQVALTPMYYRTDAPGTCFDIATIDISSGKVTVLVEDEQKNILPSYSPDGRYIAFYSSDPLVDQDKVTPRERCAGRVVNVETKEVKTLTDHFVLPGHWYFTMPPQWIDAKRVVFSTISTDPEFIEKHAGPDADIYTRDEYRLLPYVAVGNVQSGEIKVLPNPGHYYTSKVIIDEKNRRLVAYDKWKIYVTEDYDLNNPDKILHLDKEKERLQKVWLKESGEVKYEVMDWEPGGPPIKIIQNESD